MTQELDHGLLTRPDGARYLLEFLEKRLGKVPIPDAGAKAEELLVRLRRPPHMTMASWCHNVREAHRQLQRALKRARAEDPTSPASPTTRSTLSSSPTARRGARGSDLLGGSPHPSRDDPGAPEGDDQEDQDRDEEEDDANLQKQNRRGTSSSARAVEMVVKEKIDQRGSEGPQLRQSHQMVLRTSGRIWTPSSLLLCQMSCLVGLCCAAPA